LDHRTQGRRKRMLTTYRQRLMQEHGWEVPLRCGRCGSDSVPNFHGWTPSQVINFGNKPTIFANLECPNGKFIRLGFDAIVEILHTNSWGCWAGAIATDVQIVDVYCG
jgi:hypothetical protein